MTLIGIDFGRKRVGIAVSDEHEQFAFPHAVLENDTTLIDRVAELSRERQARGFVVGESKDFSGAPNLLMEHIHVFTEALKAATSLPVYLEPEFMTSQEAAQLQGEGKMLDASAAALILKSYLDKQSS